MARDVEVDVTANDNTAAGLDSVSARFRKTEDDVKKGFGRATKDLGSGLVSSLSKAGSAALDDLQKKFGKVGGTIIPVLAGAIAAASPAIGAAIGGAVLGGAGVGGVVGGVLLAARDSRIQVAGKALGKNLLDSLTVEAGVFVKPVLAGIQQIQSAFNLIRSDVSSIFDNSSRFVGPLVDGVVGAVALITDGVEKAVAAAGPAIAAIQQGFIIVGKEVGNLFSSLSDNGREAAAGLLLAFKGIAAAVRVVSLIVNGLTETFGFLLKVMEATGATKLLGLDDDLAKIDAAAAKTAGSTVDASTGIDALSKSSLDAAGHAEQYQIALAAQAEAAERAAQGARDLFGATTDVGAATAAANEALKENGPTLDANTEKGRANRDALEALATAQRAQYEATLAANGEGPKTDAVAEANRTSFLKLATQMTGSASKAEALANQILGIPTKTNTKSTVDAAQASREAKNLRAEILSIPTSRNVAINIAARLTGSSLGRSALASALNKQSLRLAEGTSFAVAAGGASRIGGPQGVNVQSSIALENVINLDGEPMRRWTDQRVADSEKRTAWRARVGGRYNA